MPRAPTPNAVELANLKQRAFSKFNDRIDTKKIDAAIRYLSNGNKYTPAQRLRAVKIFEAKLTIPAIANSLGVSRVTIWRWKREWDALRSNQSQRRIPVKSRGRKTRFSLSELAQIKETLEQGHKSDGDQRMPWTTTTAITHINEATGLLLTYSEARGLSKSYPLLFSRHKPESTRNEVIVDKLDLLEFIRKHASYDKIPNAFGRMSREPFVPVDVLFNAWSAWRMLNGHHPSSHVRFYKAMLRHTKFHISKRYASGIRGVKLRSRSYTGLSLNGEGAKLLTYRKDFLNEIPKQAVESAREPSSAVAKGSVGRPRGRFIKERDRNVVNNEVIKRLADLLG